VKLMELHDPLFVFLVIPPIAAVCHACVWFLISLAARRNDVADIGWGFGILFMTAATAGHRGFALDRASLAAALVAIWAVRLSLHIGLRNVGSREDFRYRAWRRSWGRLFHLRSFLQVFLLQAALAVVVASPATFIAAHRGGSLTFLDALGVLIWLVGFVFEAAGDWQLAQFKANPDNRGRIITSGLWRYSRHPNYFGEVVCWWGVWVLALSVPWGWLTIVGPLAITALILKVSGVPMIEEKLRGNAEYREYMRRTNMFLPWAPRGSQE
jgi:steroid 5-alpha reductase family enzyme